MILTWPGKISDSKRLPEQKSVFLATFHLNMEVQSNAECKNESFPNVEIVAPEEENDELESDTAKRLDGMERRLDLS